jgi:hypothetical protein
LRILFKDKIQGFLHTSLMWRDPHSLNITVHNRLQFQWMAAKMHELGVDYNRVKVCLCIKLRYYDLMQEFIPTSFYKRIRDNCIC